MTYDEIVQSLKEHRETLRGARDKLIDLRDDVEAELDRAQDAMESVDYAIQRLSEQD